MIPEAAFLFSIAGLSVTLAGFSGLVAAFRRGAQWKTIDLFRLRQIAEFGLANAFLALLTFPLASSIGDSRTAIRIASGLVLIYVVINIVALVLRQRRLAVRLARAQRMAAAVIDLAIFGAAALGIALGTGGAYEWLLLFLLARPMVAFVLVLRDLAAIDT